MPRAGCHINRVTWNNSGNLYCTGCRMNGCREGMRLLRVSALGIVQMHRVLGLPKFANSERFSLYPPSQLLLVKLNRDLHPISDALLVMVDAVLTYVQYIDSIDPILFKYGTPTPQILCCRG